MRDQDTVVKANQIAAIASLAEQVTFSLPIDEKFNFDLASVFDLINRLSHEIAEEVEELERKTRTGIYAKST